MNPKNKTNPYDETNPQHTARSADRKNLSPEAEQAFRELVSATAKSIFEFSERSGLPVDVVMAWVKEDLVTLVRSARA
jgi:hypothetical protein